ncbi:enoyl-CoA hydratase-related protein [Hansschlegelia quercus]|uniref:Enoyl-CoA hydratase n=1 Tax=Hansschlegelia quercus TaxID=2528245 RepID=A0A4Q9GT11_9HYPH|nr:enoyl-CoA hydratase-related protein [Hansschlegelia quercus]TBN54937.1 enoyl-CoA hydratase [Hansschlegelia quercus]
MADISIRREGAVRIIEMAEPASGLTLDNLRTFTEALETAQQDDETAAVLLVGPADAFCSGCDLGDFLGCGDLDELAGTVRSFFRALALGSKPLVAAVDGPAVGLGMTMLLHFDAVFATPASSFAAPFADLGLVPEAAATLIAPLRFGYLRAFEMLCVGRPFSATEAHALGLVTEVTDPERASERALHVASRLARKPKAALQATRALLRADPIDIESRIDAEIAEFRARLEDAATVKRLGRLLRMADQARSAA